MLEEILDKKSNFDLTSKSAFSKEDDSFTSRSYAALLAKNTIPYSHRKVADNYIIIKRVFKFQAVMSRINNTERALLAKYDFNVLEYTTVKQMYEELELLQKWSSSQDVKLKSDADQILGATFEYKITDYLVFSKVECTAKGFPARARGVELLEQKQPVILNNWQKIEYISPYETPKVYSGPEDATPPSAWVEK